jgi:hypothetical protein
MEVYEAKEQYKHQKYRPKVCADRNDMDYFDILESRRNFFETSACPTDHKTCGIDKHVFCI